MVDRILLTHDQNELSGRFAYDRDVSPLINNAGRSIPHCNVQTLAYIKDRFGSDGSSRKRSKRRHGSRSRSRSPTKRRHEPPTPGSQLVDGVDNLIKQKSKPRLCDENGNLVVDGVDLAVLDGEEFQLHNAHKKDLFTRVEERDERFCKSPDIGANQSHNNIKGRDRSLKSPEKCLTRSTPKKEPSSKRYQKGEFGEKLSPRKPKSPEKCVTRSTPKKEPSSKRYQPTDDVDDKSSPRRGYIDTGKPKSPTKEQFGESQKSKTPRGESKYKHIDCPSKRAEQWDVGQPDMNTILDTLMKGKLATCIDTTSNEGPGGRLALTDDNDRSAVPSSGSSQSLVWSDCPDSSPTMKPKRKKKRRKHRRRYMEESNESPNVSSGSFESAGSQDIKPCGESASAGTPNESAHIDLDRNQSASPVKSSASSERRRTRRRRKRREKEEAERHSYMKPSFGDKPLPVGGARGKTPAVQVSQSDTSITSSMSTIKPSSQLEAIESIIEGKFRRLFSCYNARYRPERVVTEGTSFFKHASSTVGACLRNIAINHQYKHRFPSKQHLFVPDIGMGRSWMFPRSYRPQKNPFWANTMSNRGGRGQDRYGFEEDVENKQGRLCDTADDEYKDIRIKHAAQEGDDEVNLDIEVDSAKVQIVAQIDFTKGQERREEMSQHEVVEAVKESSKSRKSRRRSVRDERNDGHESDKSQNRASSASDHSNQTLTQSKGSLSSRRSSRKSPQHTQGNQGNVHFAGKEKYRSSRRPKTPESSGSNTIGMRVRYDEAADTSRGKSSKKSCRNSSSKANDCCLPADPGGECKETDIEIYPPSGACGVCTSPGDHVYKVNVKRNCDYVEEEGECHDDGCNCCCDDDESVSDYDQKEDKNASKSEYKQQTLDTGNRRPRHKTSHPKEGKEEYTGKSNPSVRSRKNKSQNKGYVNEMFYYNDHEDIMRSDSVLRLRRRNKSQNKRDVYDMFYDNDNVSRSNRRAYPSDVTSYDESELALLEQSKKTYSLDSACIVDQKNKTCVYLKSRSTKRRIHKAAYWLNHEKQKIRSFSTSPEKQSHHYRRDIVTSSEESFSPQKYHMVAGDMTASKPDPDATFERMHEQKLSNASGDTSDGLLESPRKGILKRKTADGDKVGDKPNKSSSPSSRYEIEALKTDLDRLSDISESILSRVTYDKPSDKFKKLSPKSHRVDSRKNEPACSGTSDELRALKLDVDRLSDISESLLTLRTKTLRSCNNDRQSGVMQSKGYEDLCLAKCPQQEIFERSRLIYRSSDANTACTDTCSKATTVGVSNGNVNVFSTCSEESNTLCQVKGLPKEKKVSQRIDGEASEMNTSSSKRLTSDNTDSDLRFARECKTEPHHKPRPYTSPKGGEVRRPCVLPFERMDNFASPLVTPEQPIPKDARKDIGYSKAFIDSCYSKLNERKKLQKRNGQALEVKNEHFSKHNELLKLKSTQIRSCRPDLDGRKTERSHPSLHSKNVDLIPNKERSSRHFRQSTIKRPSPLVLPDMIPQELPEDFISADAVLCTNQNSSRSNKNMNIYETDKFLPQLAYNCIQLFTSDKADWQALSDSLIGKMTPRNKADNTVKIQHVGEGDTDDVIAENQSCCSLQVNRKPSIIQSSSMENVGNGLASRKEAYSQPLLRRRCSSAPPRNKLISKAVKSTSRGIFKKRQLTNGGEKYSKLSEMSESQDCSKSKHEVTSMASSPTSTWSTKDMSFEAHEGFEGKERMCLTPVGNCASSDRCESNKRSFTSCIDVTELQYIHVGDIDSDADAASVDPQSSKYDNDDDDDDLSFLQYTDDQYSPSLASVVASNGILEEIAYADNESLTGEALMNHDETADRQFASRTNRVSENMYMTVQDQNIYGSSTTTNSKSPIKSTKEDSRLSTKMPCGGSSNTKAESPEWLVQNGEQALIKLGDSSDTSDTDRRGLNSDLCCGDTVHENTNEDGKYADKKHQFTQLSPEASNKMDKLTSMCTTVGHDSAPGRLQSKILLQERLDFKSTSLYSWMKEKVAKELNSSQAASEDAFKDLLNKFPTGKPAKHKKERNKKRNKSHNRADRKEHRKSKDKPNIVLSTDPLVPANYGPRRYPRIDNEIFPGDYQIWGDRDEMKRLYIEKCRSHFSWPARRNAFHSMGVGRLAVIDIPPTCGGVSENEPYDAAGGESHVAESSQSHGYYTNAAEATSHNQVTTSKGRGKPIKDPEAKMQKRNKTRFADTRKPSRVPTIDNFSDKRIDNDFGSVEHTQLVEEKTYSEEFGDLESSPKKSAQLPEKHMPSEEYENTSSVGSYFGRVTTPISYVLEKIRGSDQNENKVANLEQAEDMLVFETPLSNPQNSSDLQYPKGGQQDDTTTFFDKSWTQSHGTNVDGGNSFTRHWDGYGSTSALHQEDARYTPDEHQGAKTHHSGQDQFHLGTNRPLKNVSSKTQSQLSSLASGNAFKSDFMKSDIREHPPVKFSELYKNHSNLDSETLSYRANLDISQAHLLKNREVVEETFRYDPSRYGRTGVDYLRYNPTYAFTKGHDISFRSSLLGTNSQDRSYSKRVYIPHVAENRTENANNNNNSDDESLGARPKQPYPGPQIKQSQQSKARSDNLGYLRMWGGSGGGQGQGQSLSSGGKTCSSNCACREVAAISRQHQQHKNSETYSLEHHTAAVDKADIANYASRNINGSGNLLGSIPHYTQVSQSLGYPVSAGELDFHDDLDPEARLFDDVISDTLLPVEGAGLREVDVTCNHPSTGGRFIADFPSHRDDILMKISPCATGGAGQDRPHPAAAYQDQFSGYGDTFRKLKQNCLTVNPANLSVQTHGLDLRRPFCGQGDVSTNPAFTEWYVDEDTSRHHDDLLQGGNLKHRTAITCPSAGREHTHLSPKSSDSSAESYSSCSSSQGSLDGLQCGLRVGQGDQCCTGKESSESDGKEAAGDSDCLVEWRDQSSSSSDSEDEGEGHRGGGGGGGSSASQHLSYTILKGRESRNMVKDMMKYNTDGSAVAVGDNKHPDDAYNTTQNKHDDGVVDHAGGSMLKHHAGDGMSVRSKRRSEEHHSHGCHGDDQVPLRSSHHDRERHHHVSKTSSSKKFSFDQIKVPSIQKERVRFACNENGEWAEIGRGSYGCVYLGLLDASVEVAIKDFYESSSWDLVIHEARMLLFLQETGITPAFYGLRRRFDVSKEPSEYCIIMEYFGDGRTLFNVMSDKIPLTAEDWLDVVGQLVAGLRLIHSKNVLINDLKADNILIDLSSGRKTIRYIDVGMATYKQGLTFQLPADQMNKYNFLAPEVREGAHTSYKSDIYSLGYMLDQITRLAGPPLQGLDKLVARCTDKDPSKRPSIDEIVSQVHWYIVKESHAGDVSPRGQVFASNSV